MDLCIYSSFHRNYDGISLIEDLKKRGYEVEVEFSSEWEEDRYGDAIEGSVFTLNRVTVKW